MSQARLRSHKPRNKGEATQPRRGRGRPQGDRAAKSGELIAAARKVIAREGYAGTTLLKVAREAGAASTGVVTHYFESKEAMVLAVAETLFDEYDAWLAAQSDACDPQSLCNNLLDYMTRSKGESWMAMLQLIVGARGDATLASLYALRNGRFMTNLTKLIRRGQNEGVIRRDVPADVLADQLGAMGDGWALTYPLEPKRFGHGRIRHLVDSAAAMLAPPISRR
ncbi:MAG: TetR/AcrR family transcriptional regulator [Alphaproteobacteria bacterium]|nr:TetR/AcrR family transcriptional regulator [Alphaproteobacteria bacterium]